MREALAILPFIMFARRLEFYPFLILYILLQPWFLTGLTESVYASVYIGFLHFYSNFFMMFFYVWSYSTRNADINGPEFWPLFFFCVHATHSSTAEQVVAVFILSIGAVHNILTIGTIRGITFSVRENTSTTMEPVVALEFGQLLARDARLIALRLVSQVYGHLNDQRLRAVGRDLDPPPIEPEGSATKSVYVPWPLSSARHIRILTLFPGTQNNPIQCKIEEEVIDAFTEPFEAISYRWDTIQTWIACGEHQIPIGRNLYLALMALRQADKPRRLWVDAICIDQRSDAEKALQVPLMAEIYQRCQRCLVWLGWHTIDTPLAFKLLHTLYLAAVMEDLGPTVDRQLLKAFVEVQIRQEGLHPDQGQKSQTTLEKHFADSIGHRRERLGPSSTWNSPYMTTSPQWHALGELLHNEWFQRVWTLQEIVLPQTAQIHCGHFVISAAFFYTALEFIKSSHLDRFLLDPGHGYALSLEVSELRSNYHGQNIQVKRDLLTTLQAVRARDVTEPRDKVIGALGLCLDDDATAELASCSGASADEIYSLVAIQVLKDPNKLCRLLSTAKNSPLVSVVGSLPSWIPNWEDSVITSRHILSFQDTRWFASGGSDRPKFSIMGNKSGPLPQKLCVRGKAIAKLEYFVDRYSQDLGQEYTDKFSSHFSWLGLWLRGGFAPFWRECRRSASWDMNGRKVGANPSIQQFFLQECHRIATARAPWYCQHRFSWEMIGRNQDMLCARRKLCAPDRPCQRRELCGTLYKTKVKHRLSCWLPPTATERNNDLTKYWALGDWLIKPYQSFDPDLTIILNDLEEWTQERKFFLASGTDYSNQIHVDSNFLGWAPLHAEVGDRVFILQGCNLPFIVRPSANENEFTLIGNCYIGPGVMSGELAPGEASGWEDVNLV